MIFTSGVIYKGRKIHFFQCIEYLYIQIHHVLCRLDHYKKVGCWRVKEMYLLLYTQNSPVTPPDNDPETGELRRPSVLFFLSCSALRAASWGSLFGATSRKAAYLIVPERWSVWVFPSFLTRGSTCGLLVLAATLCPSTLHLQRFLILSGPSRWVAI